MAGKRKLLFIILIFISTISLISIYLIVLDKPYVTSSPTNVFSENAICLRTDEVRSEQNFDCILNSVSPSLKILNVPDFLRGHCKLVSQKHRLSNGKKEIYMEVKSMVELIRSLQITSFMDIGAEYGFFLRIVLSIFPNSQIYAFEPSSGGFRRSCSVVTSSGNVKLYNAAVGKRTGELSMCIEGKFNVNLAAGRSCNGTLEINLMYALDDFFSGKKQDELPFAVKIDVEGHEYDVFLGGYKFFKSHGPIIFLEYHRILCEEKGASPELFTKKIEELGYYGYDLQHNYIKSMLTFLHNCNGHGLGVCRLVLSKERVNNIYTKQNI